MFEACLRVIALRSLVAVKRHVVPKGMAQERRLRKNGGPGCEYSRGQSGLLQRKDVSELLQAKLAVAGIKSISRFSAVADSRAQLRTFCERPLAMDPARDAVLVASILDAWEASKTRMEVRHKAEAEAETTNTPASLNKVEYQDIRKRFERMYYKLEDRATPLGAHL